jgi:hypothetical protein
MILAAGSGMYLYQAKHRSQLLDEQIAGILNTADANRARMQILRAEYQLLQDPSRLSDLAAAHLTLTKTDSKQFINWAMLEKTLPIVIAPPPAEDPAPPATDPPIAAISTLAPSRVASASGGVIGNDTAAAARPAGTAAITPQQHPATPIQMAARSVPAVPAPTTTAPASTVSHTSEAGAGVFASSPLATRPSSSGSSLGMARTEPSSSTTFPQARTRSVQAPAVAQSVMVAQRRYPYQPAPYGYQPPPTTSSEVLARIGRSPGNEPGVPAVASALGMARTMPAYVTPTAVSTWIPNGTGG